MTLLHCHIVGFPVWLGRVIGFGSTVNHSATNDGSARVSAGGIVHLERDTDEGIGWRDEGEEDR